MNYKQMVEDIDNLVETDFCMDMECKTLPTSSLYTQEEATQMATTLASIYAIAHGVHCGACGSKYKKHTPLMGKRERYEPCN